MTDDERTALLAEAARLRAQADRLERMAQPKQRPPADPAATQRAAELARADAKRAGLTRG